MYIWISFSDATKLEGNQFLGVAVLQFGRPLLDKQDYIDLIKETWRLGINPGGEAVICELPNVHPEYIKKLTPLMNRLSSKEDLKRAGLIAYDN